MNLALTLNGQPVTLMVSCLGDGDTGGGLLYYDGQTWNAVDDVSTTGLFVSNDELIRILWAPSQVATGTSIFHYDRNGFVRQVILDGISDPHDVLWDGRQYVAVSSSQDSVLWVAVDGTVGKRFRPAHGDDCWHLNSLLMHEGVLYATAFGRFTKSRGWAGRQREGTGMLFRVDTGEDVLTGLCCPHTPRVESGQWLVCSSATGALKAFTVTGKQARRVQLKDWVRGLAIADSYLFVGESVNRQITSDRRDASVAVLDRETWNVLGRIPLPHREVYDLVMVSPALLDGVLHAPISEVIGSAPPQLPAAVAAERRLVGRTRGYKPAISPVS